MRGIKRNKASSINRNGITLIALIITIILLLILAGVVLSFVLGDNGIIKIADEASFKTKMSAIAEEWEMILAAKRMESLRDQETFDAKNIYLGELLKEIIVEEELEISEDQVQDIRKEITNIGKEEEKYVIIHEGELYYVSQNTIPNNANQTKWCEDLGIKIWDYNPTTGIKVVNGNYENINGLYMCTPVLNTGFVKEKTRYIKESDGYLTAGNWINKKPDDDWYDYKNQKWANLYVESEGLESYYVWIPRYVYKQSATETERMDVKFVDLNNNYTDGETGKVTKWSELQAQGYKVPEAFYWGDSESATENKPIPGYWVSKYQLSELGDTYTIDFATTATPTTITIEKITVNTTETIAKYTYALNGVIVHESTTGEDFTLTGLAKGNKAINVTILDANGEIIGSMTKLYEVANVNPPDLTGFDKDTTFYVYWDENGVEYNHIPISMEAPKEWYDYSVRSWANIVTRNNGLETYLVWIPRYQYVLDTTSQRSYVKFIQGTGTETDTGYKIPEAFTWGDNGEV